MKVTRPRGTNDILPEEIGKWHKLEAVARDVFRRFGYQEIRTPVFEHTELFERGIGEATDIVEKEMYTFTDRGDRSITLRPEGTAPAVRAFIEHSLYAGPQPTKLYYIAPMFRYERPQAGRYRQHYQIGAECFGTQEPTADVEMMAMPIAIYHGLGLDGFRIHVNSIGCPVCRPGYREKLKAFLVSHLEELCGTCRLRYGRNPLRILDCKEEGCRRLTSLAPPSHESLCDECDAHFKSVRRLLDATDLPHELNPRLVRGFDYYTKTVFEIVGTHLGAQDAMGGGGRYDGLVGEIGGPDTPAVGFATGMERVLLTAEAQGKGGLPEAAADVFVAAVGSEAVREKGASIVFSLRATGLVAEMDYLGKSLKAQMKSANRLNARHVAILGEEEFAKSSVLLRQMADGSQVEIPIEALATTLLSRGTIHFELGR